MNSIWHEFLGATGARIDQDLVTDFGDPPGELRQPRRDDRLAFDPSAA
jgi:hypothetical protein